MTTQKYRVAIPDPARQRRQSVSASTLITDTGRPTMSPPAAEAPDELHPDHESPSKPGPPPAEAETAPVAAPPETFRTWTSRQGQTVEAELTSKHADRMTLQRRNGKSFTVPIAEFSDEDQAYVRDWDATQGLPNHTTDDR